MYPVFLMTCWFEALECSPRVFELSPRNFEPATIDSITWKGMVFYFVACDPVTQENCCIHHRRRKGAWTWSYPSHYSRVFILIVWELIEATCRGRPIISRLGSKYLTQRWRWLFEPPSGTSACHKPHIQVGLCRYLGSFHTVLHVICLFWTL